MLRLPCRSIFFRRGIIGLRKVLGGCFPRGDRSDELHELRRRIVCCRRRLDRMRVLPGRHDLRCGQKCMHVVRCGVVQRHHGRHSMRQLRGGQV